MPLPATPRFEPAIASLASLMADASRAQMLLHLLGGRRASATELADVAGVSPATASAHLGRLLDGGLVRVERRGRHRYFSLADASVAHLLESMAGVSERDTTSPAWRHPARARLKFARRCYGHLAGELGVSLFSGLINAGAFAAAPDGLALTPAGHAALAELGFKAQPAAGRRRFACPCHDWSEGRDHLAGALGEQLLQHLLACNWLRAGHHRELVLTPVGQREMIPRLRVFCDPQATIENQHA